MHIILQYPFWLALISGVCFALERLFPWRNQKAFRPEITQDFLWLFINGHFLGLILSQLTRIVGQHTQGPNAYEGITHFLHLNILGSMNVFSQFLMVLIAKDFIEYGIHNLIHRTPWMWEFHKVHHSIVEMDWIGNLRIHAMEGVIYKSLLYVPMTMLGASDKAILATAVVSTTIGHLNHSNLAISWGPFRYFVNSPKMHIWHHDYVLHAKAGQNFGVVFSLWDWIFGTAYMPEGQPKRLGFSGIEIFPKGFLGRFFYPIPLKKIDG